MITDPAALDPAGFHTPERLRVPIALYRAWVGVQFGQHGYAASALAEIPRAALDAMPATPADLGMLCALAEAYCALGDREGAARLLAQLEPFAPLNAIGNNFECYGAVTHYLGLLARLLDEKAAAAAYFDRAIAANRDLAMPLQLARSQALRAAC